MVGTQSAKFVLGGIDKALALYIDALLNDTKIGTMPQSVATVGTTSVELIGSLPTRVYAMLVNDSDAVIHLGFGEAAVFGQGIRLNPKGGSFEISWYNLWKGTVNGITDAINKNVSIVDGRVV